MKKTKLSMAQKKPSSKTSNGQPQDATAERFAYFSKSNGVYYAGTHLLIEFWEAQYLDDLKKIRLALENSVIACKATLLQLYLHQFGGGGGVQGVASLSQSHITIHSWPEVGYAAFDAFLCGTCDPYKIIPVLRRAFKPKQIQVAEYRRGVVIPVDMEQHAND